MSCGFVLRPSPECLTMSKKTKGVSLEEKKKRMLDYFFETVRLASVVRFLPWVSH